MIRFSFVFNRRKKLTSEKTALIQIKAYRSQQTTLQGKVEPKQEAYFSTGLYVKVNQWSKKHQKVMGHPNSTVMNGELRRRVDEMENFVLTKMKTEKSVSVEQVKAFSCSKTPGSFTQFFEEEIERLRKIAASNTLKKYITCLNYWKSFRKDVRFEELDYQIIENFDSFLRTFKLHDNSIYKHHVILRSFINRAIRKELIGTDKNVYSVKFKLKKVPTETTYLTEEELKAIELTKIPDRMPGIKEVRDIFLFSCFTGLRYGDAIRVKKGDFIKTMEGYEFRFQAQKTKKYLTLPLYLIQEGQANKIVERRMKMCFGKDDTLFIPRTNQKMNLSLKKLARLAGVKKNVTSHMARHSFVTHMARWVPVQVIQAMAQHSKIATTMRYTHVDSEMIKQTLIRAKAKRQALIKLVEMARENGVPEELVKQVLF